MAAKVAVAVTARPSWAKLAPLVEALRARGDVVDVIACGYSPVRVYGALHETISPTTTFWSAVTGTTLETSVLTTGLLTLQLGPHFRASAPDAVVVCADRHETLAVSIAASYQNIPLLHLQGGERTGSIDDKVRNANTALADGHAVCTEAAYEAVVAMRPKGVVQRTGCPSIDVARRAATEPPLAHTDELGGTGAAFALTRPYLIVAVHPDTTDRDHAAHWREARAVADDRPAVVFWPGPDADADDGAKYLRITPWPRAHYVRTLPPPLYLRLLASATLTIGNSSSFHREGRFFGVPTQVIGRRQIGREAWTPQPGDTTYGDGYATPRIVALLDEIIAP
jgi:UDP-hydrolysing UDP-N-acetyl-D-glucosamine 2-epimerase